MKTEKYRNPGTWSKAAWADPGNAGSVPLSGDKGAKRDPCNEIYFDVYSNFCRFCLSASSGLNCGRDYFPDLLEIFTV